MLSTAFEYEVVLQSNQIIIINEKVLAIHCHHMLVGEQLPTERSIWKAQVLRLACVRITHYTTWRNACRELGVQD